MGMFDNWQNQINKNQQALNNLGIQNAGNNANVTNAVGSGLSINGLMYGLTGGLNGVLGIEQNAQQLATPMDNGVAAYNTNMANMNAFAHSNYGTFEQALSVPNFNYRRQNADDIRGMTQSQRNGLIGSSALHGLKAGIDVGKNFGLVGTIFGGLVGGGIGLLRGKQADREGQEIAQATADYRNYEQDEMLNKVYAGRDADIEFIKNENNAHGVVRAVANGGQIERQQMDIRDFANKVLNRRENPMRIARQKCNGGVMIRIKK